MPSCGGGEDAAIRRTMSPAESPLALRHAVALGVLQGPAELLPISSSGHVALLPWLAGWSYKDLDAELRKSVEVALHTGAGLALALAMRDELGELPRIDRRRATVLALSLAPPTLAGFALRDRIERLLGGPRSIAVSLVVGAFAMAIADMLAQRGGDTGRAARDARATDGLALGVAQASALIPGVSRNGATLTAARARGFEREAAHALSWSVALPVILGASALKGARMLSHGAQRGSRMGLALGCASAFASTLVSVRALRGRGLERGSLLPYALYRCLLASLVIVRLRRERERG
jgi:undecaprenyl-diphosphatase